LTGYGEQKTLSLYTDRSLGMVSNKGGYAAQTLPRHLHN